MRLSTITIAAVNNGFNDEVLDIFQQFTFMIKQKEQHTNLNISNNTNKCERQKQ